jgi:hypothetical protein
MTFLETFMNRLQKCCHLNLTYTTYALERTIPSATS